MIYGAGGSIGGAVARTFAQEGATVFLAGRTGATLEKVAEDIRLHGGEADTAIVDALDEKAVDEFVDRVVEEIGRIDVSFNLISYGDVQEPLMDISVEDFTHPITTATRTQFLTTKAAARHMIAQESGVILTFGGGGPQTPLDWGAQSFTRRVRKSSSTMDSRTRTARYSCGHIEDGGVLETIPNDLLDATRSSPRPKQMPC
ncbi:SDR family NAD(P)-dependent oxidoreductase [Halocatena marina]|uniref:SDR family NAD(P)-dependent oxidoreductase n=1 Tax=Halocatena marina TaxID=2934937 RepID=A0ABD5YXQ2_9EURY